MSSWIQFEAKKLEGGVVGGLSHNSMQSQALFNERSSFFYVRCYNARVKAKELDNYMTSVKFVVGL